MGSVLAELQSRSASLAFKRELRKQHHRSEKSTPYRKGVERNSISTLIDQEADELVEQLTDEERRLILGFQRIGEDTRKVVRRHLKEMYHLGELLELLADLIGVRAIFCITDTDFREYVVGTVHLQVRRIG
jgi:hypothetical protein